MSRQSRTLIIGGVLVLVLAILSLVVRVPYVVLSPGPTFNTLGQDGGSDIITVLGKTTATTSGNLNLTTVSVDTQDATAYRALVGWLKHDEVVVPRDSVYPPGQSEEQTNAQDRQDFIASQDSATAAAACQLKYPSGFGVLSLSTDSPNKDVLKPGDQFVSLNGSSAKDDTSLRAVLKTLKAGQKVPAVVIRDGKQVALTLTLGAPSAGNTSPQLGVIVTNGCLLPFQVTLGLADIGGPSAGMMFALGIVDKIGTDDLTHGKFIAGTGTIAADGSVGAIGGIQLKMIAARNAGATVFLAPDSNCKDVLGNIPSGLNVVKVSTLQGAITALDTLNAGRTDVPHC
jgi:PDZ domain-containing protein